MEEAAWWEPFKRRETEEGITLYLHGTREERVKIPADQVEKILRAMKEGWHIDIEYADIEGGIDIKEAGLERDED